MQENGQAWLLHVQAQVSDEAIAYQALFDRTADYTEWLAELAESRKTLPEEHGLVMYDALYAWCQRCQAETHKWPPKMPV